jgi:ferredoxin-type protein NapH
MIYRLISLREWVKGFSVVIVIAAVILKLPVTFCALRIGLVYLICPMAFIEYLLAAKTMAWQLLPGILLVIGSIFIFGRAFCGWFCPSRFAGNLVQSIGNRKMPGVISFISSTYLGVRKRIVRKIRLGWRDGIALFSGLLLGIWAFDFPAYSIFCPIGVISRNLIELATHFQLRWDLLFISIPLIAGLFFNLGWKCSCPLGMVHGILAKPNFTVRPVVLTELCVGCGNCVKNCSFQVNLHQDQYDSFACSKCLNCIRDCNKNAIILSPFHIGQKSSSKMALATALKINKKGSENLNDQVESDKMTA